MRGWHKEILLLSLELKYAWVMQPKVKPFPPRFQELCSEWHSMFETFFTNVHYDCILRTSWRQRGYMFQFIVVKHEQKEKGMTDHQRRWKFRKKNRLLLDKVKKTKTPLEPPWLLVCQANLILAFYKGLRFLKDVFFYCSHNIETKAFIVAIPCMPFSHGAR